MCRCATGLYLGSSWRLVVWVKCSSLALLKHEKVLEKNQNKILQNSKWRAKMRVEGNNEDGSFGPCGDNIFFF